MAIVLNGNSGAQIPLGTAAAPSATNTTAQATGLYFPTSTTLGLSTNGTAALTIDASQQVGIGTSSPSYKLDVSGNARVSSDVRTPNYYAYNSAGNYSGLGFYDSVSLTTRYAVLETQIGTATILKTDGATPLIFGTNASERMRIDSSGNVGIGTSSPGSKLEVNQGILTINTSDQSLTRLQLKTTGTGGRTYEIVGGLPGTNNSQLSFYDATAAATRMTIDSSGNVGIGTSSAIATLDVNGEIRTASSANWNYAALNVVRTSSNTSTPRMISMALGGDSSASTTIGAYNAIWGIYNASPSASSTSSALQGEMAYAAYYGHRWYNNGTERMRIDSSGRLLVNSTSDVGGNNPAFSVNAANAGTFGNIIEARWTGTTSIYHLLVRNGNGLIGGVQSSGTTTSYLTSSDYRLKENIQPITTGLSKIGALKPVTYDWISDKSEGEGFIAHELQAVIPHAVTGEKDAVDADGNPIYQGVDYSKIVVHLVAAIQELKAELDALKGTK